MNGKLCVFGEVLFDQFPDGKQILGGAPFNVAWHLQAFGQHPYFISRVGQDPEGEQVIRAMQDWGMATAGLQTDTRRLTGHVSVSLKNGEPNYDIVHPCAYDAIVEPAHTPVECELLYHGTLALRDATSRQSAASLTELGPKILFVDVNLRPPWWQKEHVLAMVRQAHWAKLNRDELNLLYPSAQGATGFLYDHDLQGLVLTHGAEGAELLTKNGEHYTVKPQAGLHVVDTVGAGDAFASVIILGLMRGWPLDITLQRSQAFASSLVGQRGATVSDAGFYQPFITDWNLKQ